MLKLDYKELYDLSRTHPEKVWDIFAKEVEWYKPYDSVMDDKNSLIPNWFVGGEINMSYNCLDKAIEEGYGDKTAVIFESPIINVIQKISYKELLDSVERLAGVLVDKCGIKKGDRVLFYMPVIPECLIGILACSRIGAIYSVTFGGFPPKEIAFRINNLEPRLILTCNVAFESVNTVKFKERVDLAVEKSSYLPNYCIVYNRPNTEPAPMIEGRDLDWITEMNCSRPHGAIPLESNHPIFVQYTSGTTGEPKGLVMATANTVVIYKYIFKYMLDNKEGDVTWMYSDFGWITGQILTTYGPLLQRCSTILCESKPVNSTDIGQIIRIMNRHKVASIISSPTILRILRNNYHEIDLRLTYKVKSISLGGELSNLDLRTWLSTTFNCPVYNLYGQTELNGIITSAHVPLGRSPYSGVVFTLGYHPKFINSETTEEVPVECNGELILKTPLWPGVATTLYKNHDRFIERYFSKYPGYFNTEDNGKIMKDGSVEILSRIDDVIQISSYRICGGAIEEYCLQNQNLINAAVVGKSDPVTGQTPFAFLMKKNTSECSDQQIIEDTIRFVSTSIGELILFRNAVIVPDLPKTKSQKISRSSLASMINMEVYKIPATVENPEIYQVIYDILTAFGYEASLPLDL